MTPTLATARDIPLLITSEALSAERRITPSWTIAHLKTKLEPVTGIPPSSQLLSLRLPGQQETAIQAEDEESVEIGQWPLMAYAEIKVRTSDKNITISNLPPLKSVVKYEMPKSAYEEVPETVLAYKKAHKIGRFDPNGPEIQDRKVKEMWEEVDKRNVKVGERCHLIGDSTRRGSVAFVGHIEELPGPPGAPWVGIALDEPTGKNDGSVKGQKYFQCEMNRGVFVRADRVVVGDFPELALMEEDPRYEEI